VQKTGEITNNVQQEEASMKKEKIGADNAFGNLQV
jgi:hypothetical protein